MQGREWEKAFSSLKRNCPRRRVGVAVVTPEVINQLTFALLLFPLGVVLATALAFGLLILKHVRPARQPWSRSVMTARTSRSPIDHSANGWNGEAPSRWCAIRSSSLQAVQTALDLHNAKACSWGDGISQLAEHSLLISPPVRSWVLVVGQGLPDPAEDPDKCFHFLRKLSRTLGHVQYFCVQRALNHHAWVRLQDGEVLRAYAWAGETLWNQGAITRAETEIGFECFDYGEPVSASDLSPAELLHGNVEKINLLAAQWSLDPASINDSTVASDRSILGDLIHSKRH